MMEFRRMVRRKRSLWLAVVMVTAALAWGVGSALAESGSPAPAAASGEKVTLTMGWDRYPDTFNPFNMYEAPAYEIMAMNYDLLVGFDAHTLDHPKGLDKATGLAYDWSSTPDGLVWTFKLREGVKWQDGEPFTADDVVFTYKYILDNEMSLYIDYLGFIKDIKKVDDFTVEFDLSKPKANILNMWVPIVPEHIWSKIPAEKAGSSFVQKPPIIGTGPFQAVSWKSQDFVKMVANKDYWRGAPAVSELLWVTYQNDSTMAEELLSGKLQFAWNLPQADFTRVADTPGLTALKATTIGFDELAFNCYDSPDSKGNPVLLDPKFRQALNWAVDKNAIANVAYNGFGEPADTIINKGYYSNPDWHWTPPAETAYGFDLEKAKQLLDEAGYKDSNGDGIREDKTGKPISLRLWGRTESTTSDRSGRKIAGWFKEIGLKIEYSTLSNGAITTAVNQTANSAGRYAPDYDMFLWGWGGDVDPNFILSIFTTSSGGSMNNWSDCNFANKEYDDLFLKQQTQIVPEERKASIDRMQQILYEQSPYIVLVYTQDSTGYWSDSWGPWTQSPEGKGPVAYDTYVDSPLFVHPLVAGATSGAKGASKTPIIIIVAVIVVAAIVAFVIIKRRPKVEETL